MLSSAENYSTNSNQECEISSSADWAETLNTWTHKNRINAIVTARIPLGPVRKRLTQAMQGLNIPLIEVTRNYDKLVWPHAKAGFFSLKKKIPEILKQIIP